MFGSSPPIITWFQTAMENKFTIIIKLNVDSFLGMQLSRNRTCQTRSLSQPGYIANLMSRFNINISKLIHYLRHV
jgi:hypothetical protein